MEQDTKPEITNLNESQSKEASAIPNENEVYVGRNASSKKKPQLLIILLAVIILAAGIWGLVKSSVGQNLLNTLKSAPIVKNLPQASKAPSSQAQVKITDQGFIPATLLVKKGTQITWINTDSRPHQIASDPHPLHNLISSLYQDKPTSGSYSFIFTKVGTYTYHDETNPLKYHGTVIVK